MAVITNYTTLQTAIADNLARSDLTSFLPNFTQQWEERFYRTSQNWGSWMESALNATITNGVAPVPTDYLGLKVAYISGQRSPPLKRIGLEQLYQRYPRAGGTGVPAYIARNGSNFEFGPIAGSSGNLVGTYYAKPTVLRTDSDGINWLITNAPDLCLYGSLLEAEVFIKHDERLLTWKAFYDSALDAYRTQMREEDYSGSAPNTVVA
jgi:hypothetical protein